MTTSRVIKSLAVLLVAGAASLRADFMDFSWRCSGGAVRACASLQVYTTLIGGGGQGTSVRILVRNLQGFANMPDNTGGSIITRIGLVAPTISGAANLNVAANGAATGGNPGSLWFLRNPGGLGGLIELTAGLQAGTTAGGITGCGSPLGGFPTDYFQTCNGGWVEFTFTTTNDWSANDAQVAWLTQGMASGAGGIECDSHQGGPGRELCLVTPEPLTMVLLGSGLAGVGGFGLLRRRRKDNDVSNG